MVDTNSVGRAEVQEKGLLKCRSFQINDCTYSGISKNGFYQWHPKGRERIGGQISETYPTCLSIWGGVIVRC